MRSYIGIGSNLGDPVAQVRWALAALAKLPLTARRQASSLYRNPPMGPADQPDYVNAVAELETDLNARALLAELHQLEAEAGRLRDGERWGPRLLDLDILVYGQQQIDELDLTIPHRGMPRRAFVLYPLFEIAPSLDIPGFGPVRDLLSGVDGSDLIRVG